MKFALKSFFVFLILGINFSLVFSTNTSTDKFNAEIVDIYRDLDYKYYLDVHFQNMIDEEMLYNIDIFYEKDNIKAGNYSFLCNQTCLETFEIEKIIFGNYYMNIYTQGNSSFEKINFSFEYEEPKLNYQLHLNESYQIRDGKLSIKGKIESFSNKTEDFTVEIFPKSASDERTLQSFSCQGMCNFTIDLKSLIVIDEYVVNVYSRLGETQRLLVVDYPNPFEKDIPQSTPKPSGNISNLYNFSNKIFFNNEMKIIKNYMKVRKGNKELLPSQISENEYVDLEIDFMKGNVKKIKVDNTRIKDTKIGFEYLSPEKYYHVNRGVMNAFAINPVFSKNVTSYQVSFVAYGEKILKCDDYDFEAQACFGEYYFFMDTIPGKEYTINLTPKDPIFLEIHENIKNYILSPFDGECQGQGDGWALSDCQDYSLSSSKICPAGFSEEAVFCDDGVIESHMARRGDPAGVRFFFKEDIHDRCTNITKVEVLYKISWSEDIGNRTISISKNGSNWVDVITSPALSSGTNLIEDVTKSLTDGWNCDDFFNEASNAGIKAFYEIDDGDFDKLYNMTVDTLIYRVSYSYNASPLLTDKSDYEQGDSVIIKGYQVWDDGANVSVNLIKDGKIVDTLSSISANSTGGFVTSYILDDYLALGNYSVNAIQDNDSSINHTYNFTVNMREPFVYNQKRLVSLNETINFSGSNWAKSENVNIEIFLPSGEKSTFEDNITSSNSGEFEYNYKIPFNTSLETGIYLFKFSSDVNETYHSNAEYSLVFGANSSEFNSLYLVNKSDYNFYNIGTSPGNDSLEVGFPKMLPLRSIDLQSFKVNIIYFTTGSASRTIEWLNPLTSEYESVCNVPYSPVITRFECDMRDQAVSGKSYKDFKIRLNEDGGSSEGFYVDYIYVTRDFDLLNSTVGLGFNKNMSFVGDGKYKIELFLENLDSVDTPKDSNIFIYAYVDANASVSSPFFWTESEHYNVELRNDSLSHRLSGNIYQFELVPKSSHKSSLAGFDGSDSNSNNSVKIWFNVTGNGSYYYDKMVIAGFDPRR